MTMCDEWVRRGYDNSGMCLNLESLNSSFSTYLIHHCTDPSWLGSPRFHNSHRSNLLRKNPEHYSQFNWELPDNLPYVWPV